MGRTIEEHRKNIQEFANKHKIVFDDEGECGLGRMCVGLRDGHNWIDYNPIHGQTYENIKEVYNKKLYDISPAKAYHKHHCLAVLGRDEESIIQLSEWVDELKKLNVTIVDFETGADRFQAMFTGFIRKAVKVN